MEMDGDSAFGWLLVIVHASERQSLTYDLRTPASPPLLHWISMLTDHL
jgi:hypothetical protein